MILLNFLFLFKRCLLRYLNYYEVSALRPFLGKIKACDFSAVNVFFVGSVPGSHVIHRMDPFENWGHAFVAKILGKHNEHHNEHHNDHDQPRVPERARSLGRLSSQGRRISLSSW